MVAWRVREMASDVQSRIIENWKPFILVVDESCDVWQPTAHRVFVFNLVIAQVMKLSKELKTTAEGHVNEWTFLFGRCDLCTDRWQVC